MNLFGGGSHCLENMQVLFMVTVDMLVADMFNA